VAREIRVGMIGTRFMGRAHSNALIDVQHFYDLPVRPVLQVACGRSAPDLQRFAERFGWQATETSWERLVEREDVDLVDISTSNVTHCPIAVAAARRGKHILCEKPLAMNTGEARQMLDAVREAGVTHMVAFNYRRVPALALARQLIETGKIGKIYHFNATYYQDWLVDPNFPITWRHDAGEAGSGAHGDLNAHIIDLGRYLVGEFEAVTAARETFIGERPLADGSGRGPVTVDDAVSFLARFRNGALGSFQATRLATGRKNMLRLEIFGSAGGLVFNLERLNELQFYSLNDTNTERGYRTILVTEPEHPYLRAWWPTGHILGWEHTFIHQARDLLVALGDQMPVAPDFYDGLRCQQVLDAALQSCLDGRWITIPEHE